MNRHMIALVREIRGITQGELADKISMSHTSISKMEKGEINISDDTLNDIAQATNFPVSFFTQEYEVYPEPLTYRKREKVAQKLLSPIQAKINLIKFNVQHLLAELDISGTTIPIQQVTETNTPAVIAQKVRKAWKITSPVIDNVVHLLEEKGIITACFDFATERVDSRCITTDNRYPAIIFNKTLLGDRQRFSLAYQLGHLIMHVYYTIDWNRDVGHEANLFASEFLMPEKEIRKDFDNGITLALLASLKKKWKVSMISLLYRADDLGYLTPNQKRYLLQQFNEQNIRRREPKELDIPPEQPNLLRQWISNLKKKKKLSTSGIAAELHLNIDDFIEMYS
ncbi:MAG: XRE family transcriptional regulator [Chitinophagales bacterium]|nr:XRE family transcriptional regulator [Chitinophagales bacterium]